MTITTQLKVARWSAWAPGIEDLASWQAWAKGERVIQNEGTPALKFVPALQRRRFSSLSRKVLQAIHQCFESTPCHPPSESTKELQEAGHAEQENTLPDYGFFCSRHGELKRTVSLLKDITERELPSPTAFSLSVHNTSAGLYSIFFKTQAAMTATASGRDSLETALMAAGARLKTGRSQRVLVVYADEPLPTELQQFEQDNAYSVALALELTADQGLPIELSAAKPDISSSTHHHLNDNQNVLTLLKYLASSSEASNRQMSQTSAATFETLGDRLTWSWALQTPPIMDHYQREMP